MPEDSQRINRQGLTRLISVVSRLFDYVLIDSMMSTDPVYQTALHAAVPGATSAPRPVVRLTYAQAVHTVLGAPPDASRFGDSWAVRATVTPHPLLEIEVQAARNK